MYSDSNTPCTQKGIFKLEAIMKMVYRYAFKARRSMKTIRLYTNLDHYPGIILRIIATLCLWNGQRYSLSQYYNNGVVFEAAFVNKTKNNS